MTCRQTAGGTVATTLLGSAIFVAWFAVPVVSIVTAMVALAIVVGIAASRTREERARRRASRHRIATRRYRLRQVGALRAHQYEELQQLVESCEPSAVDRFDLEGLLDQFASLAEAHWRHAKAVEASCCDETATGRLRSAVGQQIRHRREELRHACMRETELLADDLETIDELVRFVVQRALTPPVGTRVEHDVDWRLADLEEVDHAHEDLARSCG